MAGERRDEMLESFLEYVFCRLLGPPVSGNSYRCPYCEDLKPRLMINPPRAGCKIKFRCHRCQMFGDEHDVLKLVGVYNYTDRLVKLKELRAEYEAAVNAATETGAAIPAGVGPAVPPSPGEAGSQVAVRPRYPDDCGLPGDWRSVDAAFANVTEDERQAILKAYEVTRREKVSFIALAVSCMDFENFVKRTDEYHLAECDDPDCDTRVCREARGLPPLTRDEIRRSMQALREARQRAKEEHERWLRGFEERLDEAIRVQSRRRGGHERNGRKT